MKKLLVLILCFCLFVSGCGVSKAFKSSANRGNLSKLEVGMSKEEVTKAMGRPYKTEVCKEAEYWFYYTADLEVMDVIHGVACKAEIDFTPIGFVEDKVEGWGRGYYRNQKR